MSWNEEEKQNSRSDLYLEVYNIMLCDIRTTMSFCKRVHINNIGDR